jgi:hypothetical protein
MAMLGLFDGANRQRKTVKKLKGYRTTSRSVWHLRWMICLKRCLARGESRQHQGIPRRSRGVESVGALRLHTTGNLRMARMRSDGAWIRSDTFGYVQKR